MEKWEMNMIKAKALVNVALDGILESDNYPSDLGKAIDQAVAILQQARREIEDDIKSSYY